MKKRYYLFFFLIFLFCSNERNDDYDTLSTVKKDVTVTHLAIDGFLFSCEGKKILFDALWERLDEFTKPRQAILEKIIAGEPPYDGIAAAVASNPKSSHFSPSMAIRFLKNNPDAVLICTKPVQEKMVEWDLGYDEVKKQLIVIAPKWGQLENRVIKGLQFRFLAADSNPAEQKKRHIVLTTILEMGGKRFFHMPDLNPGLNGSFFESANVKELHVDFMFADHEFLMELAGQVILNKYAQPKKLVLMHIDFHNFDETYSQIRKFYPKGIVFTETLQQMTF